MPADLRATIVVRPLSKPREGCLRVPCVGSERRSRGPNKKLGARAAAHALEDIHAFLCLRQVERYMSPAELVSRVSAMPWRSLFAALAELAAIAAHDESGFSPRVKARTTEA